MSTRRVVVTGLGALTPIGNTVTDFWDNLLNGVSGADRITVLTRLCLRRNLLAKSKTSTQRSF